MALPCDSVSWVTTSLAQYSRQYSGVVVCYKLAVNAPQIPLVQMAPQTRRTQRAQGPDARLFEAGADMKCATACKQGRAGASGAAAAVRDAQLGTRVTPEHC